MSRKNVRSGLPAAPEDFYTPYSHDELAQSRKNRKLLTALNELDARLWQCVHFAENACECVDACEYTRALAYFKQLDIGDDFTPSSTNRMILRLRSEIVSTGEGNVPVTGRIRAFSKVLATYVQLLAEIHGTDDIIAVDRAGRSIVAMLTERQISCGDAETYEKYVEKTFDIMLKGLAGHFAKVYSHLLAKAEQQRESAKPKPAEPLVEAVKDVGKSLAEIKISVKKGVEKIAGKKRKGRKPKIKLDIQEAVWNIHERAGKLQSVRNMHPKGIATKENEFRYAKRE
ncbi:MAG: hypothetical protein ILO34_06580, partial [Kiritimatiellae bacterium]|nr:hypothetical protein [Kiritimatiellia bacterium]